MFEGHIHQKGPTDRSFYLQCGAFKPKTGGSERGKAAKRFGHDQPSVLEWFTGLDHAERSRSMRPNFLAESVLVDSSVDLGGVTVLALRIETVGSRV